jgi:hypothetical protein
LLRRLASASRGEDMVRYGASDLLDVL